MPDKLLHIAEHNELRREISSGAVIDVNSVGYGNYLKSKNNRRQQQEKVNTMEIKINNMETDIADIKSLLYKLLEK